MPSDIDMAQGSSSDDDSMSDSYAYNEEAGEEAIYSDDDDMMSDGVAEFQEISESDLEREAKTRTPSLFLY